MLPTRRFNELIPRGTPTRAEIAIPPLPPCALEPFESGELDRFPAFELMRLVRDWVEGEDESSAGLWWAHRPARLYEDAEQVHLCAAHAVVGHLCLARDDAGLPDATLLHSACRRYWGSSSCTPTALLEGKLSDERPPGWSRLAPWWRAAAMLQNHSVELAALGLHHLWMRRKELDLATLATDETFLDDGRGSLVRVRSTPPPFHLRSVLIGVLGPDDAGWPAFERALLGEWSLDSTPAEADC